jgi:hypothetical protein
MTPPAIAEPQLLILALDSLEFFSTIVDQTKQPTRLLAGVIKKPHRISMHSQMSIAPTDQPNPHDEAGIGAPSEANPNQTPSCKPSDIINRDKDEEPDPHDDHAHASDSINTQYTVWMAAEKVKSEQHQQQEDYKRRKQQALWDQNHTKAPEPAFTRTITSL